MDSGPPHARAELPGGTAALLLEQLDTIVSR